MQANIPDKSEPKAQGRAKPKGTQSKIEPLVIALAQTLRCHRMAIRNYHITSR